MRLAVRKFSDAVPNAGYHYFLHPLPMNNDFQERAYKALGHIIIEVDEEKGMRLLEESRKSLVHQLEISVLTDYVERSEVK